MSKLMNQANFLPKSFWVIWGIELWERFGYYATQAILAIYFVEQLGFSQEISIYTFGSFSAFVVGFIWIGGYIGDHYLNPKISITIGAIFLFLSYCGLALANTSNIFYALGGIIVGNALFKANPSLLISKMYKQGDPALDGAMTLYYMAINLGSLISMSIAPFAAQKFGWKVAFWISAFGLFIGILNYFLFYKILDTIPTKVFSTKVLLKKLLVILVSAFASVYILGVLLPYTYICYSIVYFVVCTCFFFFIKKAFYLKGKDRIKMLIAFLLIIEATVFFVLYNQIPTSLTFFALHNINNNILGWVIPAASYQLLNPLVIIIASPILATVYKKYPGTHVTKFCLGMTLCGLAFLVLFISRYFSNAGLISPYWMLATYILQSLGELLIAGLGIAMVAELCPSYMSGFVMGIWFVTSMLAGPIGAYIGNLTSVPLGMQLNTIESLDLYTKVFGKIGLITLIISIFMWLSRPWLNKHLK